MRSYLDTTEIMFTICMAHLMDQLDDILKKQISKEERTALKFIRTYFNKYNIAQVKRIDKKAADKMRSKILNYIPRLEPFDKRAREKMTLYVDDYYNLIEEFMAQCCCECDGKDGKCHAKKVMQDSFIPPLDLDESRPCEYMFKMEDLRDD